MSKPHETRTRDLGSFKPIGLAFAAVVAGVAPAGHAVAAEPIHARPNLPNVDLPNPALDPRAEEDAALLLGPSEAVEPFSTPKRAKQGDLFDL
ncbi:MAG: hypothetical protein AB7O04_07155 [Hyphomonadaceae bacterium]